ncbi:uncharacterized protein EV154DRAFT_570609 [Mucor mucedo]|uniref:uncharacterized protein n=1 Tax=Mucor mucedo TaxID=29922 RepID=UPI00221EA8B4|nr:uncharacterized protein EV154DRAFT_570609 [Mucor mucedo]KAI7871400.1 hypothetical protein EV154DRAFT_570609 [Mucor mucedo]
MLHPVGFLTRCSPIKDIHLLVRHQSRLLPHKAPLGFEKWCGFNCSHLRCIHSFLNKSKADGDTQGCPNQRRDALRIIEESLSEEPSRINNNAGLVQLINAVYLSKDPVNPEVYETRNISMNDVLAFVWRHSFLLQDTNSIGFGKWCGTRDIDFIKAKTRRTRDGEGANVSVRQLFVLKDVYVGNVVSFIINQLDAHKQTIRSLKEEGCTVVGYARKSKTREDDDVRFRLLEQMCSELRYRSEVDKVFVSCKSNASDPIVNRDVQDQGQMLNNLNADGNTQDLLNLIARTKVCLVMLTFGGFSTNTRDFARFLSNNPNVRMIIVDNLPQENSVVVLSREELLNNPSKLGLFKWRTNLQRRLLFFIFLKDIPKLCCWTFFDI